MVRVVCPSCQSRLTAKAELVGQVRPCPKCRQPVRIEAAEGKPGAAGEADAEGLGAGGSSAGDAAQADANGMNSVLRGTPLLEVPERLDRRHRYAICDRGKIVATWENNGRGWLLKTPQGAASAARNPDKLPPEGDFRLVELCLDATEAGLKLTRLVVYQLARRWALAKLARGDDEILAAVTGPAGLGRGQKFAVREHLAAAFMREVWHENRAVLDYLSNEDCHSPGAG
jgi:hypothetical protein